MNFEKRLIFLTSNLGAREMFKEARPEIGFTTGESRIGRGDRRQAGEHRTRPRCASGFLRSSSTASTSSSHTSRSNTDALAEILDHHLGELQRHVHRRLGERSFEIEVSQAARQLLLGKGASVEYGARELKRTIHRMLTQPLATLVADRRVPPGGRVNVETPRVPRHSTLRPEGLPSVTPQRSSPSVLVLDENTQLVERLERELAAAGVTWLSQRPLSTAATSRGASESTSPSWTCCFPTATACPWRSSCCGSGRDFGSCS